MTNPSQLSLLADHIKLSLLERQRAISLGLEPNAQDGNISRSLESLREGIESIEQEQARREEGNPDSAPSESADQVSRLRSQYTDLMNQFSGGSAATGSLARPNNPSLAADFDAAQTVPRSQQQNPPSSSIKKTSPYPTPKSVRFRDDPSAAAADIEAEDDEAHAASRAALFPYRDDPSRDSGGPPDQTDLSNSQIHTYHSQVLREQDEQLDRLGESIGRQRDLSIQIGDELDEHVAMLDEVDRHVDRHQGRLNGARERIGKIARKANDNKQITVIVVLIVILVLLIIVLKR